MDEAYTGNLPGRREVRISLKIDTAPYTARRGSRPCNVKGKAASKRAQRRARLDSIGVEQDRGMVEKKRTDEGKPPESGDHSPRTREASGPLLLGGAYASKQDVRPQLTEEPNESPEESDPPIVVRDGKTDYMAKERADVQRSQSTDARGKNVPTRSVSSTLIALNRKAKEDKNHRFKDLYRLIDLQMLYTSYRSLQRNAAPGVTYEDHESNVDERPRALLDRHKGKRRYPNHS